VGSQFQIVAAKEKFLLHHPRHLLLRHPLLEVLLAVLRIRYP
jgi:hypothetical protein